MGHKMCSYVDKRTDRATQLLVRLKFFGNVLTAPDVSGALGCRSILFWTDRRPVTRGSKRVPSTGIPVSCFPSLCTSRKLSTIDRPDIEHRHRERLILWRSLPWLVPTNRSATPDNFEAADWDRERCGHLEQRSRILDRRELNPRRPVGEWDKSEYVQPPEALQIRMPWRVWARERHKADR